MPSYLQSIWKFNDVKGVSVVWTQPNSKKPQMVHNVPESVVKAIVGNDWGWLYENTDWKSKKRELTVEEIQTFRKRGYSCKVD